MQIYRIESIADGVLQSAAAGIILPRNLIFPLNTHRFPRAAFPGKMGNENFFQAGKLPDTRKIFFYLRPGVLLQQGFSR